MDGKGDPPPRAASEVPDIAAQAHAAQLQLMAMASRPAAGHGGHGGPGRGSILGLGGGGRGFARGTGRQGRGRGRAHGDSAGQGNGPPLGSRHDAAGHGDGVQDDAAATQANRFAYRVLQRGMVASTTLPATQASRFPDRVLQQTIKQKRKGLKYCNSSTMQIGGWWPAQHRQRPKPVVLPTASYIDQSNKKERD